MSLVLAGLIVAGASGAVAVGRWLARRREDGGSEDPAGPRSGRPGESSGAEPEANVASAARKDKRAAAGAVARPSDHLDGFPCQLGDVLMRITGEEAWLAGGLVLIESAPVAVLFVAPDAGTDAAIYARPHPRESIFWMQPLDPSAVLVGGEPPSSVEHEGIRFDRVRRLPLRPRRIGVGAPDVGDSLVLAEYDSAGSERLLVMKGSSGTSCAFRGVELEPSSYEVIASGRSTLDLE